MKVFLNVSQFVPMVIGLLLANAATSQSARTAATRQVCHESFKFCLVHPPAFEPVEMAEGFVARSEDDLVEIRTTGKLADVQLSPKDLFDQTLAELGGSESPIVVSTLFGEDFFQANFLSGDRNYFLKAFLMPGYHVRLLISVPANRPDLVVQLREQVDVQFVLN